MSGIFQGIKNFFGFGSQDGEQQSSSDQGWGQQQQQQRQQTGNAAARGRPRGSQAKRQRAGGSPPAPVLQDAVHAAGGVQGLDWYARSLRRDSDGELVHESLAEGPDGTLVLQSTALGAGGGPGCRVVDVCGGAVTVQPRGGQQQQQQQQQTQQRQTQQRAPKAPA